MSLTTMTRRLRRDWFANYLQNPLAYRPGTRMPTPFPNGKTTLPDILGGGTSMQARSMWAFLGDGDQAILPLGLVTGEIELIAFDEAVMYRNLIEGAGTRAIGVGYPEKLNLAFDANQMRLAMIWHGAFIDAALHWTGRGAGFEKPLGDSVLNLPDGATLATLESSQSPWPKTEPREMGYRFRGYHLGDKRQPTFLYSLGDVRIEDYPTPVGESDFFVFQRTLSLSSATPPANLWLRAAAADKIENAGQGSYKIDERLTLRVAGPALPELRKIDGNMELIVPVVFENGKAKMQLTYDW
jgi:hypothetical protein